MMGVVHADGLGVEPRVRVIGRGITSFRATGRRVLCMIDSA